MDGNPTGFQIWVNADITIGIIRNKKDECNIFLAMILILIGKDPFCFIIYSNI